MLRLCLNLMLLVLSLSQLEAGGEVDVLGLVLLPGDEHPSAELIEVTCSNTDLISRKKCAAYRMVRSYLERNYEGVHSNFAKFIGVEESKSFDEFELKVIYRYAVYLELMGQNEVSRRYFRFLKLNAQRKSAINILSAISLDGLSGNQDVMISTLAGLKAQLSGLADEEKIAVFLKLAEYINETDYSSLFSKHKYLIYANVSIEVRYVFLSASYFFLSEIASSDTREVYNELKNIVKGNEAFSNTLNEYTTLARDAKVNGDYDKALHYAKLEVTELFGEFNSASDLLAKYRRSELFTTSNVTRYATTNLYQTRLGRGIEPVKHSFEVLHGIFKISLDRKYERLLNLTSIRSKASAPYFHNILIVGNYLYEKTKEEAYLEESISILDGYVGAGTYFWVLARERMRNDPAFSAALTALLEQEAALSAAPENQPLAELFARDQHFRQQRKAFREDYADFYEALNTSYELNLPDLRTTLGRDSSAAVCFYMNEFILYRFFISGDTTELTILDRDLEEVKALTRKLKAAAGTPRHDQSALAADNHRLYSLLFRGLDSLLTPGLHIVASDELIDVPFAGLRISAKGEEPRYLGTEYAISRQFSLGSMMALAAQRRMPRYAAPLALAPTFTGELLSASALRQAGFTLSPLLYNQEEVRNIQNHGRGAYYFGQDATLAVFRRNAPDYGILHFASHAVSSQLDGIRSRVFLLDDDGEPAPLFASDLAQATLNADLVVLSACETGGGGWNKVEGRVGLTKAFLGAGARAVVASSWAVDDYATAEIMNNFYATVAMGVAPHEALRQARVNYLTAHPGAPLSDWAAFEAYGGMVAPVWELEGQRNWWLWGGGLAALFGLGLGTAAIRRAA